ncbi:MAG: DNA repair protein RadA [Brevinematia bacterium]
MYKSVFICTNCGYKSSKWLGRCPECQNWNSFTEELLIEKKAEAPLKKENKISPVSVKSIKADEINRFFTGIEEFDRVTGGILKGQTILISGEPGIGKSTLVIMITKNLSKHFRIFYVNGEESNSQIKLKFVRLGINEENIFLLQDPVVELIINEIENQKNCLLVIDSIQTIYSENVASLPGSLLQIRECVYQLVNICKNRDIPLILIGHITKKGEIAGPKIIEHIVDSVFFLELDNRGVYRIIRALKNRFYKTDEIGIFSMEENGLVSQKEININPHDFENGPGIVYYPHLEGSRVILTEVQALVSSSILPYPKRICYGVELNRFLMLIAIMEKKFKINLSKYDIYLNITNGLNISDSAIDLSIIYSIYSSYKEKIIPSTISTIGEVGLSGEVRYIRNISKRIKEAQRAGIKEFFIPYNQKEDLRNNEIKIFPLKNIEEGIKLIFS